MKNIAPGVIFITLMACSAHKEWVNTDTLIEESLHDIEVIDDRQAVMYSYGTGNIYRTEDGGEGWELIHRFDSIYFEQLQFLDESTGWLAGSPNKIYKTVDGGISWEDQSLKEESQNAFIYGMYFNDPSSGYVAALERDSAGFITKIFHTTNSGKTWQLINEFNEMLLNLEKIGETYYATGNHVIIKDFTSAGGWEYAFRDTTRQMGQIRDIEKNPSGKILAVSFNGYLVELDEGEGNAQLTRITSNRIRNLIAIGDDQWIAAGDSIKEPGTLLFSMDNGNSWEPRGMDFPDVHRIAQSNKKVWVVGKQGLVMTRRK